MTKDEAIEHLLKETYQQAYKAGYIDGHKDGTLKTIPTPEQAREKAFGAAAELYERNGILIFQMCTHNGDQLR